MAKESSVAGKRLFVTGATGFIGSHFMKAALGAGHPVVALRVPGTRPKIAWPGEPQWIDGTMDEVGEEAIRGCEVMVHFAAVGVSPQVVPWEEYLHWNVASPLGLAQRAVKAGVRRIISCGSCFEVGRAAERYDAVPVDAPLEPTTAYGTSKALATVGLEGLCREMGFELATLRLFHVYGEGQHESAFWASLKAAAESGGDFCMTAGEQIRDYISVEEVAKWFMGAVARVSLAPGIPKRFNVGSGRPATIHEFAETWWRELGATGKLLVGSLPYRPNEVMRYVPRIEEMR